MEANNRSVIPFVYQVTTSAIVASGQQQQSLTLQTDSFFELQAMLGTSSLDLDNDFMPNNFSVQITDQSSGRQLSSAKIPQRLYCGPSNGSILERVRLVFPPQATLLFDFTNLDSGSSNTINFILKGYKHLI